jgi:hypothetical protein
LQPVTPFSGVKEPVRQQLPLLSFQTAALPVEAQLPVVVAGPVAHAVTAMDAKSRAILLSLFMLFLVSAATTCSRFCESCPYG